MSNRNQQKRHHHPLNPSSASSLLHNLSICSWYYVVQLQVQRPALLYPCLWCCLAIPLIASMILIWISYMMRYEREKRIARGKSYMTDWFANRCAGWQYWWLSLEFLLLLLTQVCTQLPFLPFLALSPMFYICSVARLCWALSSERQIEAMRIAYLKSILRQEMAFFDTTGTGALTSQVVSNTLLMQVWSKRRKGKMIA